MSNEQPSRPPKRSGSGASPMGSTLAIVIAIAAVVVGFLILKNIRSDDDDDATSPTAASTTSIDPLTTTALSQPPVETQPTVFTPTTAGAKVLVANSSHANGVAGTLTTALQGNQFTMGTATNGATKEAVTKIQYLPGDAAAQAVAQSVASLMGVAAIEPMPTPVLLQDPTLLADNTVLILLGDDKAGKTLAQMVEPASADTTAAGVTTTTGAP
jgi:hypothetical protein